MAQTYATFLSYILHAFYYHLSSIYPLFICSICDILPVYVKLLLDECHVGWYMVDFQVSSAGSIRNLHCGLQYIYHLTFTNIYHRGYAKARLIHRRGETFKFGMYCLYGYGIPIVLSVFLAVMSAIDLRDIPWLITPSKKNIFCFLGGK